MASVLPKSIALRLNKKDLPEVNMALHTNIIEAAPPYGWVLRVLIIVLFGSLILKVRAWSRLSHVPGPFLNSITDLWLLKTQFRGKAYVELKELTDKYGDLVRIGPNSVLTIDPKFAVRASAAKSQYSKGQWYATFRFEKDKDHVFSLLDENLHLDLRRKLGPGYAASNIMDGALNRQLPRLIDLINEKFLSSDQEYKPLDLADILHLFTLDVVGDFTLGQPYGFLDEGKDSFGYLKWNQDFFPVVMTASTIHFLAKLVQLEPFARLLPKSTDSVGLGRFISVSKKAVDEHFQPGAKHNLDMVEIMRQHGVSKEEATNHALLQVVAGTDSVATTLRMTLLYTLSTPRVYNRLVRELDVAIEIGNVSSPITDVEARNLSYLQAVIREGLRVFPGAVPFAYKTVPEGGDVVCGYNLPAGTQVSSSVYGILRSKKYWGEDADLFRPERWLQAEGVELERMKECLETQFGYGRYKCLGRPVVSLEMNKVIPEVRKPCASKSDYRMLICYQLLRRYDMSVITPHEPIKIVDAGFFVMSDLWMRFSARESCTDMHKD
ncbi:pisatin demethylase [Xylariales sp. PMI_506]|nr:pisatin demethylase [Xylariales sp. PMI_506]